MDGNLFRRLAARGWSLENRSALLMVPLTLIAGGVTALAASRLVPSLSPLVPLLIFFGVGLGGAAAQRRFLDRHYDDPESGLRLMGDALDEDEDRG